MTLRRRAGAMDMMSSVARSFSTAAVEMKKRGTYYRGNAGQYEVDGREAFGAIAKVGHARSRREIGMRTQVVLERAEELLRIALDQELGPVPPLLSNTDAFESELAG